MTKIVFYVRAATKFAFVTFSSADDALASFKENYNAVLNGNSLVMRFRRVTAKELNQANKAEQSVKKQATPKKEAASPVATPKKEATSPVATPKREEKAKATPQLQKKSPAVKVSWS